MKSRIVNLFVLIVLFASASLWGQNVTVQVNAFEPLPEVSFSAFLTNPYLRGTPRILQVLMTPHGKMVKVYGTVEWRRVNSSSFNRLFTFTTKPFFSRNFYNDDLSSVEGIEIEESSNSSLYKEALKEGKPTGTYRIKIEVITLATNSSSESEVELNFLNPAQTLTIIEPRANEKLDVAGVLLTWTDVAGAKEFIVKANIRSSKFESLEEALQKGNPLVDENVGKRQSVNLRELLKRELLGGEEIVVQVRAIVPAPGGPTTIYSDIVNFKLRGTSGSATDDGMKEFKILISRFLDDMKDNGKGERNKAYSKLQKLLADIQSGKIDFSDIKIRFQNGKRLTYAEFKEIIDYLRKNPDLLANLNFEEQ